MNTENIEDGIKSEPIIISDSRYTSVINGTRLYLNEAYGEPPTDVYKLNKDFETLQREFSKLVVSEDDLRNTPLTEIFESLVATAYSLGVHHTLCPNVEFDSTDFNTTSVYDAVAGTYANVLCGEEF